ncbi:response regulator [Namhaeicola litoreus]|uniref:Response regulator n=1 Tax=Namhaeicola litoreus TaxID=1052145 RepID=A0ABW3Y273_9FLAO
MKRILIIEDDQIVRENTAELLRLANYHVFTAEDGKIGIDKAVQLLPDLILCDILMPVLDGYGVLQIVMRNEKLKGIPFVFMTAKIDHTDIRKGMNMGASDYLTKPFNESELLSTIETRIKLHQPEMARRKTADVNSFELLRDAIEQLTEDKTVQYFKKGSVIYAEESSGHSIYFLLEGEVKIFKNHEYGKELIVNLINEGEFFGFTQFNENQYYTENAVALTSVKLIKINKHELGGIFKENPNLAIQFMDLLIQNLDLLKNHMLHLVYDSVRKKTAEMLLELDSYNEESNVIEISRNNLANLIGIAKETLIRTLTELRDEQAIQTSRKAIKIINRAKLMNMR